MKNQRLKRTAIKALLSAGLLGFASVSWAQVVGTIAHLSGPLVAKKPNGTVKVLAVKSEVENGDTLVAEKNTYAQIKFVDNGEITLRPGTVFKIENYSYSADKPENDAEHLELIKGGLRSVTGLLGKRNKEKFALKTPSATIGIRGTTFVAQYVPPPKPTGDNMRIDYNPSPIELGTQGKSPAATPATGSINRNLDSGASLPGTGTVQGKAPQGGASQLAGSLGAGNPPSGSPGGQLGGAVLPPPTGGGPGSIGTGLAGQLGGQTPTPPGGGLGSVGLGQGGTSGPPVLAPGLHLQVTDGAIIVTNNGGSQGFQAGQFGFVPSVNQPPVIVPSNPGIQFVPPPTFNSGSGGPTASNGPGQGQATDCIVR